MRRELVLLWALYFVQGLPFGFQATAVPVLLRAGGASLTAVGFSGALAAPWLLKPLWAPLVDRYWLRRFGRRKSWLLPMQLALGASAVLASGVPERQLAPLLAVVLLMNLFAATLDIAVDGLAVDVLRRRELGHGNAAQVVGYKLGMLSGGGLFLWLSGQIGQSSCFIAMAVIVGLVLLATYRFKESSTGQERDDKGARSSLRDVARTVGRALVAPGGGWLLAVVGTYKLGESMADAMFKPFVLDAGFSKEQVGLWIGSWGMAASILGSLAGGLLASRWPLVRAVALTAALRVVPLAAQWWLATTVPTAQAVIVITAAEHLFGGALTTTMFALMMSRVDRRVGASHFTVLAAVEVLGKTPAAWASGVLAEQIGYGPLFAIATLLSAAFLALLVPLGRATQDPGSGIE